MKGPEFDHAPCCAKAVGAAFEGSPTSEKAIVFVFEGQEYLVPFTNKSLGVQGLECVIWLARAEMVLVRPFGTSKISEMRRTRSISPRARLALMAGVKAAYDARRGIALRIVPFGA